MIPVRENSEVVIIYPEMWWCPLIFSGDFVWYVEICCIICVLHLKLRSKSNFTGPHFLPSSQMIWLGVWQVHGLNAVQAVFCTVPSCWSSSKGILSCCSHATLLSKTWSQLQAVEVGGSIPPKNSLFNHFNLPVCSCPSKVTLCFSMFIPDFTLYIYVSICVPFKNHPKMGQSPKVRSPQGVISTTVLSNGTSSPTMPWVTRYCVMAEPTGAMAKVWIPGTGH